MAEWMDPTRYLGNQVNHQRMYDFERDIIRVKNPLNTDFTFVYDGMEITVPALSSKDMERYFWRRYLWAMMGQIHNQLTEARMEVAHDKFSKAHPDALEDPYLINTQIYDRLPRFDNAEFQKKVHDDCFGGVVSKFGARRIVKDAPKNGQLDPNTPLYQQLVNDDKQLIDDIEKSKAPIQTMPAKVSEVTLG